MAVTSNRSIVITMTGDVSAQASPAAAENTAAPGSIEVKNLANGANTITPPTGTKAVTIIPPAGNTTSITFKGVSGDTGLRLHNTDPSSFSFNAAADTFVLTAGAAITGMTYIWT